MATRLDVELPNGDPGHFLTLKEVCCRVGLGRTTVEKMEKCGTFPARRRIGPKAVRFVEAEIVAWQRAVMEGREWAEHSAAAGRGARSEAA